MKRGNKTKAEYSKRLDTPAEPDKFAAAYAAWLAARAAVWKAEAMGNTVQFGTRTARDQERCMSAALDAQQSAEWQLLRIPANTLADIQTRAIVVGALFADADLHGHPMDNRHRLMLAALIHELAWFAPE